MADTVANKRHCGKKKCYILLLDCRGPGNVLSPITATKASFSMRVALVSASIAVACNTESLADSGDAKGRVGLASIATQLIAATIPRPALLIAPAIMLAWFACTAPASAQAGDAAGLNFVGHLNTAIKKAAAGDPRVAAQRLCEDLGDSMLDLETMMKTASAGIWDRMDPSQRQAYRTAFHRHLMKDCAKNAADYLRATVELTGVRSLPAGEKIIGTRRQGVEDGKIMMWKVRPKEAGKLMVTDVLVEGRSAMLTLREQATLANERSPGDVSALIDALER